MEWRNSTVKVFENVKCVINYGWLKVVFVFLTVGPESSEEDVKSTTLLLIQTLHDCEVLATKHQQRYYLLNFQY